MEVRQPRLLDYVLCAALYYLGVRIGIDYGVLEEGIAQIWAANAALLTPLLLFQGRKFYVFIAIVYLVEVSLSLAVVPLEATLAYTTANVLECVVVFLLLRRWGVTRFLDSFSSFSRFLLAGPVIGALCAALWGGYIYTLYNDTATNYLDFVRIWWMGDATGLIIFGPLLMAFWPGADIRSFRRPTFEWYHYGLILLQSFVFLRSMNLLGWDVLPLVSPGLLLPIAIYFSSRLDVRWVLLINAAVSLGYVARFASVGHLFGNIPTADEALLIQEFILTISTTTVGLSVLMNEFRAQQCQLNEANQVLERTVAERTRELRSANRKLRRQATTDALTGILNRRVFFELANKEYSRTVRNRKTYAIAMIDIDHFKKINDTVGHMWGDEVLKRCAHTLGSGLRHSDTLARYGGEEFAILLPETNYRTALSVLQRVHSAFGISQFELDGRTVDVTTSLGFAIFQSDDKDVMATLQRADQALLLAKRRGRNRVEFL